MPGSNSKIGTMHQQCYLGFCEGVPDRFLTHLLVYMVLVVVVFVPADVVDAVAADVVAIAVVSGTVMIHVMLW